MTKSRFTFMLLLVVAMFSTNIALAQTRDVRVEPIRHHPRPTLHKEKNEVPKGRGNTLLYIGSGYNFLNSNTKSQAYLNDAIGVNASIYQPLVVRKVFTFGIHIGAEYAFSQKDNFGSLPNAFHVIGETSSTVAYNSNAGSIKQSAFKIEVGPQLNIHIGNHFVISPAFLVGGMVLSQKEITADQTTIQNNILGPQTYHYTLLRKLDMTAGALALTPKIRFHYLINDWMGLWVEANYTIAPAVKTYLSRFTPQDTPDSTGYYDRFQLDHGTTTTEQRKFQYTSIGVNGGLVFSFGRKKEVRPVDFDEVHGKVEPRTGKPIDFDEVQLVESGQKPPKEIKAKQGKGGVESTGSNGGETETILSEEGQTSKKSRNNQSSCAPGITYPANDGSFNTQAKNHIDVIFPPSYTGEKSIRIYKLSEDPNYLSTLKTSERERLVNPNQSIPEDEMQGKKLNTLTMSKTGSSDGYTTNLDNNTASEGTYMVYAGSKGCQSNGIVYKSGLCFPSTETFIDSAKCQNDGSIKVWGHFTNTSPPGKPLTAISPIQVMNTTDNVSVIPTLVSPATIPLTSGTTHFTFIANNVSCKKIQVSFNLTYLNCAGASSSGPCATDAYQLPCCRCDDCDIDSLTFKAYIVSNAGSNGTRYDINDTLISNKPIYGVEFQVLSFHYSDVPSVCGNGVNTDEQSGMFLLPGTTVNHRPVDVFNISASGANNYASKDVQMTGNVPLTGRIPFNLRVGVPGPLPGLGANCCTITYDLCVRVKVFYEKNSCKSCTFIKCFHFANQ